MKQLVTNEIRSLYQFKKTERKWHIPVLASLSVGIPLLSGLYFNQLQNGLTACLSGMIILYMPINASNAERMFRLLICSFGFMVAFTIGLLFSFNPIISSVVLGLFAVAAHWVNLYFKMKAPGSFFFIMLAAMASCQQFDLSIIPYKIGLMGLGAMNTCILALLYSLFRKEKKKFASSITSTSILLKNKYANFMEALIIGFFMFASLLLGHLLHLQNPYWLPISCIAVMQGATLYHIWQRSFHRILGTFIGFGLCWIVLSISTTPLSMCLTIIAFQFIIEMLVVRQYALAVIFITPLTVLLAEAGNPMIHDPNALLYIRLIDITIGSLIGALGGWILHQEKIRYHSLKNIRRIRIAFKNRIP